MQDYRRLIVWQKAHALAVAVRKATRDWRRADCSALRSQITRAARSVAANIVEGCYATSPREFARFIEISIKSSAELEYHLRLAHDYGLLQVRSWEHLSAGACEVRRMLVGLRRSVLSRTVAVPTGTEN